MKTAFLYVRVSTDEQADKGYSLRDQEEMLLHYCNVQRIQVLEVFREDHSAKTFDRPQFNRMLMQLRKKRGAVDLVLFRKWDRFSRNAGDAYGMINTLNKLGVDPQGVEQPLDLAIPENKMMLAFYLAAPEVENDRRSLNTIAGMRRAMKEGRWVAKPPFGYMPKYMEDGKRLMVHDPAKAEVVRWIFDQLAVGTYSSESVWKMAKERGLSIGKNAFYCIIRNPFYTGKIRISMYKDEAESTVAGIHEPLIGEDLFYQVQDILDGKKRPVTRIRADALDIFQLRGFLICEKCGRLLTASSSKGRNGYHAYYHCTKRLCRSRYRAEATNLAFLDHLRAAKPPAAVKALYRLIFADMYEQVSEVGQRDVRGVQAEIARLTAKQGKARDLLLNDSLEADDYKAIKRECESQLQQLEARLAAMQLMKGDVPAMLDSAVELLCEIDSVYQVATTERKRDVVGSMFPGKLQFDGESFRTARLNEAASLIFNLGAAFSEKEKGTNTLFSGVVPLGVDNRARTGDLRNHNPTL
jgi:site-specific DNA recombinase